MSDRESVKRLRTTLDDALAFREQDLVTRKDWGALNFSDANDSIERVFSISDSLHDLPLEQLSDRQADVTYKRLNNCINIFEEISAFSISGDNPQSTRDQLLDRIKEQEAELYDVAVPLIGFLGYQQGDFTKDAKNSLDTVKKLVAETTDVVNSQRKEAEEALEAIRAAAVKEGAAVFTGEFQKESGDKSEEAKDWLKAAGFFAASTFIAALVFAFGWLGTQIPDDATDFQAIQIIIGKAVILSILLGSTIWCGRIYKALMHQATVNRHRALSIQTLMAFRSSAAESTAKDAVVIEAAKAVFGNVPTGLLAAGANENTRNDGVQIIELAKPLIPGGNGG